jgi:acyl-CoA thioesterase-1
MSVADLMAQDRPLRWVFTGDSITHGAVYTHGERDYVQLFAERLRWELGRRRDHVIPTGISGRTIDDLEGDLDWSVRQYRPDIVSIMLGLNDCAVPVAQPEQFATSYRRVIDRLQDDGATVVLHTPNRMMATETRERVANLPAYVDAVRQVARDTGVALVDHYAEWARAEEANRVENWIDHGCHPNAVGHRVLARRLLLDLDMWDAASSTGRLYIPFAELLG